MTSRPSTALQVTLVCAVTVLTTLIGTASQQSVTPPRKPGINRTTPALERMTPSQREIARTYRGLSITHDRVLDDQVSVSISSEEDFFIPPGRSPSLSEFLRERKCGTDATVMGTVTSARSYPTEDGEFLFTEYSVDVLESVQIPGLANSNRGDITVVRIGGALIVDGVRVSATIDSVPLLAVGKTYILFGKYNHKLRLFRVDQSNSAFIVTDTTIQSLRPLGLTD